MRLPLEGGCQCGRVRYRVGAAPLTLYACHCTECQRQSGSAFGLSLTVPRDALGWSGDEPATWRRAAASGHHVEARFCRHCGTRLWHEPSRAPAMANIKPGTLDDTSWLEPVGHLWVKSAQPGFRPEPGELVYDAQAPDMAPLREAFRTRGPRFA